MPLGRGMPRLSIAWQTASRVPAETAGLRFNTRETVEAETFAILAMSVILIFLSII